MMMTMIQDDDDYNGDGFSVSSYVAGRNDSGSRESNTSTPVVVVVVVMMAVLVFMFSSFQFDSGPGKMLQILVLA
ncbi:hypothetical protein HanRHA438_Chr06g0278151 [Helianthus annuus]|uniref:Transmembrane protein n=1 Tax=Helianthus annuus TaxID=4232 RepID=A0A251S5V6_HELAN|nr:hypothetical protein HanXRQr2_Chr06g0268891 [Helianthus annuus]KAJ0567827.1 hypothetical protein HanIR_Chr06g0289251 [Helianthus annuus]KAJ0574279.1 hypothetical protein HanHA89_Chr06g0236341 [Helianthus annuus]KAJ0738614.1 hypothetical protein HanLR1_Chr06g0220271 [Helianthus annuus]KAJ0741493.1 hypothetical protein HanOQP8_Chr06g0228681 [Helianthus annuus]